MTLVMKFGGTSVGSEQAMRETAVLIQQARQEWGQVVVVASGMGSKPVKVTDLLLNGAHTAVAGDGQTYQSYAEQLRQIQSCARSVSRPRPSTPPNWSSPTTIFSPPTRTWT